MKVGDLVRDVHDGEVLIITRKEKRGYHIVYNSRLNVYWEIPTEHLEVINESR
jgi:hypothetical protein